MSEEEQMAQPLEEKELFKLDILHMVLSARNQHGLKHGFFENYRQYCSRRLRRIRRSLKMRCGKIKFISKELKEEKFTDVRFLELIVVEVERSWAYGMQLKQEMDEYPRKKFHMLRKFQKASFYSQKLIDFATPTVCNNVTVLEAQAYHNLIAGTAAFEKTNYALALESLTKSSDLYVQLISVNSARKKIYSAQIHEMEPSIRYSAVSTNSTIPEQQVLDPESVASKLESIIEEYAGTAIESLKEIEWDQLILDIKQYASHRDMLSARLKNIDRLLLLEVVHCDQLVKDELTYQSYLTKVHRAYFIAIEQEELKKWTAASSVYEKGIEMVGVGLSFAQSSGLDVNTCTSTFHTILLALQKRKCTAKAHSYLTNRDHASKHPKPVGERLDDYQEFKYSSQKDLLIKVPPRTRPVHCKPLFFDLALQEIPVPDLTQKTQNSGFMSKVFGWN